MGLKDLAMWQMWLEDGSTDKPSYMLAKTVKHRVQI